MIRYPSSSRFLMTSGSVFQLLFVLFILRDIFQLTVEDLTELIERKGTYIGVFTQPVKLTGTELILADQLIL